MAAGDKTLNILIRAQDFASSVIRGMGSNFGPVGVGLAAIGVAAIGVGVESTKMAGDFQQSMLSLVAHAGLAKDQMDTVSQSVLKMSTEVGRSPTELSEALYPILSAFSGIQNQSAKSAIALDTLKMSFQTVAGTTVNGTAVANAAVGTFNALGLATDNVSTNTQRMTGLFDVMDKTVQLGNMQWDAYKNVVSKLAVAIQGTGIKFNESQAALATLTNEGYSAQRASTYLSNTFTTIAIKTDALAKHAKTLGISWDSTKYASLDLAGKIAYLNQVTDGNKQKVLALLGNNSTALKTFNALSVGIGNYKSNLDALNHSQGALKTSFDEASKGFNFQMERLKAAGDAIMIAIGSKLLPVASQLVATFTPLITGLTSIVTQGAPVTSLFSQMADNWKEFAGNLDTGEIVAEFQSFTQTVTGSLGDISNLAGPFINNLDNLLISLAGYLAGVVPPALSIARQAFAGVAGIIERIMLSLEGNLFPALQHLAAAVMPLVIAIAQWVAGSGMIPIIFAAIGLALDLVIGGVSLLINIIAGLISFFTQTQVGVALLIGILTALGAVLLVIAIASIPAIIAAIGTMLVGFATWIVGAVAVGIANVIAFWPIILIILAIVAVVALVVIVIKNWGAISKWLVNAWHAAISWIGGALNSMWAWIKGAATAAWNFLVNIVKQGAHFLYLAIFGPFLAIGALFQWLYAHNIYFKQLIDSITGIVKSGLAWLQNAWHTAISWIIDQWTYLKTMAEVYFLLIYVAIELRILQVEAFLHRILSAVIGFLRGVWNTVWGDVVSVWQKISGIFSSAWNSYISKPLQSIWTSISGWFTNLGKGALNAGVNFINMLVSGITSGAGKIWNAVTGIAKTIWSGLGFHSPTEAGPGRDADRWMPNLITMLVRGLNAGVPAMRTAALNVAAPLAQIGGLNARGNAFALGGSAGNAFALQGSGHTIVIQVQPAKADIHLDGRKVGEGTMKYAAREIRLQGNIRNK